MKSILVLGVTRISDSYPNVKYKLAALGALFGEGFINGVIAIEERRTFAAIARGRKSGRLGLLWKLSWGHLRAFYRCLTQRSDAVYICYPGIVITAWLGLPFIRARYGRLYLDAFISLYDTVVCDRRLLKAGNPVAKLLFALERRALNVATTVVVDTPENARYYSELFGVPLARFHAVPLSIPPLPPADVARGESSAMPMRCVFVGTFVPLQGVPVIVDAVRLLADDPDFEFVFVGDGQDARYLEAFLESSASGNVSWHRGHFPTEFIAREVLGADLCLGVFGKTEKTDRVLPYKLYYYLAMAAPVITASTSTAKRMLADSSAGGDGQPLAVVPAGDAQALADALRHFRSHGAELEDLRGAAGRYYQRALSDAVVRERLSEVFEVTSARRDSS